MIITIKRIKINVDGMIRNACGCNCSLNQIQRGKMKMKKRKTS